MAIAQIEAARELAAYLRHRAQAEGRQSELTPEWFIQEAGTLGCTIFDMKVFGVQMNRKTGKVESDEQQPRSGFLDDWNNRAIN